MKTPRSVDLSITRQCNLLCKYCSYFTSAADINQDLPEDEWIKFFEGLNSAYINYCAGNSPALAYTLYGEENHPSPDACLTRFLEAAGKLPDEALFGPV